MTSNSDIRKRTDDKPNDDELNLVSGGTGAVLTNVSKVRSEISMTFARNSRA